MPTCLSNFDRSEVTNDTESTANTTPDADGHPSSRNASSSQENLSKPTEEETELFASLPPMHMPELELEAEEKEKEKSKGPRALRRRHGKKMDRSKLRRKAIQHIFLYFSQVRQKLMASFC